MQTFKRAALRQILEKREPALPAMAIRFHPGLPDAQLMDRNGGLSDCAGAYLSEWFVLAGHTVAPRRTAPFFFSECCRVFPERSYSRKIFIFVKNIVILACI